MYIFVFRIYLFLLGLYTIFIKYLYMHYKKVKSILSSQNGMNIYRGCTHGCIYCDSRSNIYNMRHKFEDIEVKENALKLLKKALISKREKCMIGMGAMTDPYLHLEKDLCYVRESLKLIDRYGFGFTAITKSDLVLRDLDLLKSINNKSKAVIQMTLTTYDDELCKKIEPHVTVSSKRFEVLKKLNQENIPTVVWMTPILPFINDTKDNIKGIIDYCVEANVYGIICFEMGLTLREGNREYFYSNLDKKFPGLREKYVKTFGDSYTLPSRNNNSLMRVFKKKTKENGIIIDKDKIFRYLRHFPRNDVQSSLIFD